MDIKNFKNEKELMCFLNKNLILIDYINKIDSILKDKKIKINLKQIELERLSFKFLVNPIPIKNRSNIFFNHPLYSFFKDDIEFFSFMMRFKVYHKFEKLLKKKYNINYSSLSFLLDHSTLFFLFLSSFYYIDINCDFLGTVLRSDLLTKFTNILSDYYYIDFSNILFYSYLRDRLDYSLSISDFVNNFMSSEYYKKKEYDCEVFGSFTEHPYEDLLLYYLSLKESRTGDNKNSLNEKISEYSLVNKNFLDYRKNFNKDIFIYFSELASSILGLLIDINFLENCKKFSKEDKKLKDYVYIVSAYGKNFNLVYTYFDLFTKLPMISRPLSWNLSGNGGGYYSNKSGKYPLVKPLPRGESSFSLTKFTINTVNKTQSTAWRVNKIYLKFIQTEQFRHITDLPTDSSLFCLYDLFINKKSSYNKYINYNSCYMDSYYLALSHLLNSSEYKKLNFYDKGLRLRNLKSSFSDKKFWDLRDSLRSAEYNYYFDIFKYIKHFFIINLCNIFIKNKTKKLYNPYFLDFKGKLNPEGWGLNQHSSIYKHLLEYSSLSPFFTKFYLNSNWFYNMKVALSSYYLEKTTLQSYEKFIKDTLDPLFYCESTRDTFFFKKYRIILYNYFSKGKFIFCSSKFSDSDVLRIQNLNLLVFSSKEKLNFLLCFNELISYLSSLNKSKFKSNFHLTLNQPLFGPMLYSFLSRSINSSILTCGIPFPRNNEDTLNRHDICTYFLSKFKKDLIDNNYNLMTASQFNSFSFFRCNFDSLFNYTFSKSIITPTFYNTQDLSIFKKLKDTVLIYFDIPRKVKFDNLPLKSFSFYIYKLIRKVFPELTFYQGELISFAKILYKFNRPICIKTLDGCEIKYSYISFDKALPLRLNSNKLNKDHYLSFPENFIHSINYALFRILIHFFTSCWFFKVKGACIPLHDGFCIHANQINFFLSLYKYLYIYIFFYKILSLNNGKLTLQLYYLPEKCFFSGPVFYLNYLNAEQILDLENNGYRFFKGFLEEYLKKALPNELNLLNISIDDYNISYDSNKFLILYLFLSNFDSDIRDLVILELKKNYKINFKYDKNYNLFAGILNLNCETFY